MGGGTAGSVLAGRLSEIPYLKVLLLEAGGEQTSKLKVPWFHLWLPNSPHSWNYVTESQDDAMKGFEHQVESLTYSNIRYLSGIWNERYGKRHIIFHLYLCREQDFGEAR